MDEWEKYPDEFRDFSLLTGNQLLLGILMSDLPVITYKIEVGTIENQKVRQPLIFLCRWIGGIRDEVSDSRRIFQLTIDIQPYENEFKIIFRLNYTGLGQMEENNYYVFEGEKVKSFIFSPNDRSGEAITNETLIWIRQMMAEILSTNN